MTATELLESLPPALTRRGPGSANDVTLAKAIRSDLVLAVKRGALPDGTKCSVRIDHHAALTVEIVEWHGGAVFCDEYAITLMDPAAKWEPEVRMGRRMADARYSQAMNDALALVERIADRHNYDDSDSMVDHFDVGYYLTVKASAVAAATEQAIRAEADPAFAALTERAGAAAKALGPKVVRSVCGRGGVGGCGQWALERLVKMADKAAGREVAYDKRRGWTARAA